jgi:hypothetical protein
MWGTSAPVRSSSRGAIESAGGISQSADDHTPTWLKPSASLCASGGVRGWPLGIGPKAKLHRTKGQWFCLCCRGSFAPGQEEARTARGETMPQCPDTGRDVRSSRLFPGGKERGTTGSPGGSPLGDRQCDVPIRVTRGGTPAEHRGAPMGDRSMATATPPRGGESDYGSRVESPSSSRDTAPALHGAEAPRHGGHPARRLHGAGGHAGDRSRWVTQALYAQHLRFRAPATGSSPHTLLTHLVCNPSRPWP